MPVPAQVGGRRRHPVLGHLPLVIAAALAGALVGAGVAVTVTTIVLWMIWVLVLELNASAATTATAVLRSGVAAGALVAVPSVAGVVPTGTAADALCILATLAAGSVATVLVRARTKPPRRVVLVGSRSEVEDLAAEINPSEGALVVGAAVLATGPTIPVQSPLLVPTVRRPEEVPALLKMLKADTVLVGGRDALSGEDVRRLSWDLEGLPVTLAVASPLAGVAARRVRVDSVGGAMVIGVGAARRSALHRLVKAVFDRVGALVLIVLTSPLLALMWLAVRLDSRGSGFFVQTRAGQGGRPFRMFKMRTMHTDAEARKHHFRSSNESDGPLFKMRRDPRVTRIGSLLRRSSLDELPQLFNVLRGEMSLVGPRPALPTEVAAYTGDASRRLAVKPGMTGLWQVSGRSDLSWEQSLRLDLYYTDNWSIGDDLAITARTVAAVVQARGAY